MICINNYLFITCYCNNSTDCTVHWVHFCDLHYLSQHRMLTTMCLSRFGYCLFCQYCYPGLVHNLHHCDLLLNTEKISFFWNSLILVLVLVYTQEGSLWSIVLRCDDHTGIFTCDGCARDPYFYVPAETQSYVIKLSCSRKVLAASGD